MQSGSQPRARHRHQPSAAAATAAGSVALRDPPAALSAAAAAVSPLSEPPPQRLLTELAQLKHTEKKIKQIEQQEEKKMAEQRRSAVSGGCQLSHALFCPSRGPLLRLPLLLASYFFACSLSSLRCPPPSAAISELIRLRVEAAERECEQSLLPSAPPPPPPDPRRQWERSKAGCRLRIQEVVEQLAQAA